jgi:hypothetical protein
LEKNRKEGAITALTRGGKHSKHAVRPGNMV